MKRDWAFANKVPKSNDLFIAECLAIREGVSVYEDPWVLVLKNLELLHVGNGYNI